MKKLLFGLIAIIGVTFTSNAQIKTKDDARLASAKTFVSFKKQLTEAYLKSTDYSSFEKNLCGNWNNTKEGKYLLNEVYTYFKNKTSDEKIIASYDGIGMAKALQFQQDIYTKNPKSDGSELFGGPSDNSTTSSNPTSKVAYPCRWYQLSCHLNQIFGAEMGGILLNYGICTLLGTC
ncbi:hypothetical protein EQG63_03135 [Flavobacterium amnicola]|uniref:Uncharacterized protein n=1 Tax=Flavobacterium amnicola TaxID=2506422 RepID=A0A4Q1K4Y6_9FLAO|nr:hypothetical protein [Flavobacterium amnicola]RXR20946.1 hypothetical protein EQG63_03135 [Flavobacterium amnicola]